VLHPEELADREDESRVLAVELLQGFGIHCRWNDVGEQLPPDKAVCKVNRGRLSV
jgi:hypothetical protein